jgi:hypothetical protein
VQKQSNIHHISVNIKQYFSAPNCMQLLSSEWDKIDFDFVNDRTIGLCADIDKLTKRCTKNHHRFTNDKLTNLLNPVRDDFSRFLKIGPFALEPLLTLLIEVICKFIVSRIHTFSHSSLTRIRKEVILLSLVTS